MTQTGWDEAKKESIPTVRSFADLPNVKENEGKVYIVRHMKGIRRSGLYYSNGKKWKRRGKAILLEIQSKLNSK